jgi:hypothetical protein
VERESDLAKLAAFLWNPKVNCRRNATAIIFQLSYGNCQDRMRNIGVIERLTELLSDGDMLVRRQVSGALCNLAYDNSENQAVIRDSGGAVQLLKLLADEDTDV